MKNLHKIQPNIPDDIKYAVIRWNSRWGKMRSIRYIEGKIQVDNGIVFHGWHTLRPEIVQGWTEKGKENHSLSEFRMDMLFNEELT